MSTVASSLRKAALLIRSLDAESAALLLAQLSPAEAKAVRGAIRELGAIDPDEQAQLAEELSRPVAQRTTDETPSGFTSPRFEHGEPRDNDVELALSGAFDAPPYDAPLPPASPSVTGSPKATPTTPEPFGWLENGDIPTLAGVLEREHLSTVAVVLSHLPPERAGALLAALPAERRAAALERLADLGESDRESLEVLEQELADWIAGQKRQQQLRADRVATVRSILTHATGTTRDGVLAEMARRNSSLASEFGSLSRPGTSGEPAKPWNDNRVAGQLGSLRRSPPRVPPPAPRRDSEASPSSPTPSAAKPPMPTAPEMRAPAPRFDFWRLTQLGPRDLAELLRHCDGESLVLALAGGSDEIMAHVSNQLPAAAARELHRRVNHLAGIRLSDVAKAQDRLCLTASELMAQGRIHPAPTPTK